MKKMILGVILVVLGFIVYGCSGTSTTASNTSKSTNSSIMQSLSGPSNVDKVKNGSMHGHNNIGGIYDKFVKDAKWDNSGNIVYVSGIVKVDHKDANIKQEFLVSDDGKSFKLGTLTINGKKQDSNEPKKMFEVAASQFESK